MHLKTTILFFIILFCFGCSCQKSKKIKRDQNAILISKIIGRYSCLKTDSTITKTQKFYSYYNTRIIIKDSFNLIIENTSFQTFDAMDYEGSWKINKDTLILEYEKPIQSNNVKGFEMKITLDTLLILQTGDIKYINNAFWKSRPFKKEV